MERRTALKIVALGTLAPADLILSGKTAAPGMAWAAEHYQLRFFTVEENEMLDALMEMIIPADKHSPGTHAAQVSLFADRMVGTSGNEVKEQWKNGLRLMREESAHISIEEALAKSAAHEDDPKTDLERFFGELKTMTINGYYTSEIGIHGDLLYQGNTYLTSFPGCTSAKS